MEFMPGGSLLTLTLPLPLPQVLVTNLAVPAASSDDDAAALAGARGVGRCREL